MKTYANAGLTTDAGPDGWVVLQESTIFPALIKHKKKWNKQWIIIRMIIWLAFKREMKDNTAKLFKCVFVVISLIDAEVIS
jgi:hypothetical protein